MLKNPQLHFVWESAFGETGSAKELYPCRSFWVRRLLPSIFLSVSLSERKAEKGVKGHGKLPTTSAMRATEVLAAPGDGKIVHSRKEESSVTELWVVVANQRQKKQQQHSYDWDSSINLVDTYTSTFFSTLHYAPLGVRDEVMREKGMVPNSLEHILPCLSLPVSVCLWTTIAFSPRDRLFWES